MRLMPGWIACTETSVSTFCIVLPEGQIMLLGASISECWSCPQCMQLQQTRLEENFCVIVRFSGRYWSNQGPRVQTDTLLRGAWNCLSN